MPIDTKKRESQLSVARPTCRGPEIAHKCQNEQPKTPRRYVIYNTFSCYKIQQDGEMIITYTWHLSLHCSSTLVEISQVSTRQEQSA